MVRLEIKNLQYNINREAAKITVFSPGDIDKCEYCTGQEILPLDQSRVIEHMFTYSPLKKALGKRIKTVED